MLKRRSGEDTLSNSNDVGGIYIYIAFVILFFNAWPIADAELSLHDHATVVEVQYVFGT